MIIPAMTKPCTKYYILGVASTQRVSGRQLVHRSLSAHINNNGFGYISDISHNHSNDQVAYMSLNSFNDFGHICEWFTYGKAYRCLFMCKPFTNVFCHLIQRGRDVYGDSAYCGYKNKVWRAGHSWIFRARKAWWSHLQARRRSLRAC